MMNVQDLIKYMKYSSPAHMYATSMSAPAVQQVISALEVILGLDGSKRGKHLLCHFVYSYLDNCLCICD